MVAYEADAVDLDLGPLEDLDHDLGVARIAPFEQRDRGEVVAFLDIEPLNLRDGRLGASDPRGSPPLDRSCPQFLSSVGPSAPGTQTFVRRGISRTAKIKAHLPLLGGNSST